jgi:hypothetical protein
MSTNAYGKEAGMRLLDTLLIIVQQVNCKVRNGKHIKNSFLISRLFYIYISTNVFDLLLFTESISSI